MDGNDGFRPICNLFFYFHRINIERLNNRFYKNRGSTGIGNSQCCGDIRIGRNNDFIACTYIPSSKYKIKRIETCSYANTVFCTTISGKFILELFQLLPLNEPAAIHYTIISSIQILTNFIMHRSHINKRYVHFFSSFLFFLANEFQEFIIVANIIRFIVKFRSQHHQDSIL